MTMIVLILSISAVAQIIAAFFALRLIPITRRKYSWILISSALFLMSIRRLIPLYHILFTNKTYPTDLLTEFVGLIISIAMLLGVIGIQHLFKEYKQNLDALKESEQKFATAFQLSPVVIAINNISDGRFIDINQTFIDKTGFTYQEVIGQTSAELNIFRNYNDRLELIDEVKNSFNVYTREMVFRSKTGEIMHGLLSSGIVKLNGNKCMLSTIVDITDKKNIELEKYRMLSIIEKSLNEIYIINANTLKFEYANQGAINNIGYSLDELKQLTPIDLMPFFTYNSYNKIIDPLRNGEKDMFVFENLLQRKNRSHYYVEVHQQIHRQGKEPVFFAIVNDITQRKKNEEEIKLAKDKAEESDRLKTSFLHNISHEIRTPMNAIIGFSEFLKNPALTSIKRDYYIDIINQSTYQLLSIITDIINIATIEAGQEKIHLKSVNINHKLDLIMEQFSNRCHESNTKITCRKYLIDQESYLLTDETKLFQIITNLVNNSLKFASGGIIEIGYNLTNDFLEFYVSDNGPGIPLDMQEEIFKRFRQLEHSNNREFGGSGLGLSISKAYVELLGGKIWVESTPGQGSKFLFTIPYQSQSLKNTKPGKTEVQILNPNSAVTILIAEDEDSNYILLYEILSDTNINIIRARNGREALEICQNNAMIDLVLMDMKMPEMDGYDATRHIKSLNPKLPVIAQTAFSDNNELQRAMNSGCNDFISKPINSSILISKIKHHLSIK